MFTNPRMHNKHSVRVWNCLYNYCSKIFDCFFYIPQVANTQSNTATNTKQENKSTDSLPSINKTESNSIQKLGMYQVLEVCFVNLM